MLEKTSAIEQEKAFIDSKTNVFAVYQLNDSEELRGYRFTGTKELENLGLSIERENYNLVYVGKLGENISINQTLNEIYQQFNIDRPQDFTGHSLSVSDVVSLNIDGVVSSHFVDSFGFEEQPLFLRDIEVANFIGEDYFFIDEKNGTFSWLYFNEDGSDGGHFVKNDLYFQDVIEAAKEHRNEDDFFNQSLADKALQYLGDVGTVHFYDMKKQFTSGTHQLSGLTDITMKELIKKAENYLRATEISTEQNYNQIDGIINNEPPRTVSGYTITDSHSAGGYEFAFGENEKAPSPYATWQRNIKNDEERADGENWFWGHYFSDKDKAVSDFKERVNNALEEVPAKRPSVKEQLKAFKEMDTQKKGATQKNKEVER